MRKAIASIYMLIAMFIAFCAMQIAYAADPISTKVTLDTTAPTIGSITIGAVDDNGRIPFTFTNMKDATSGLQKVDYTISASGMTSVTGSVNLTDTDPNTNQTKTVYCNYNGKKDYTVSVTIYDVVGNTTTSSKTQQVSRPILFNVTDYTGTFDNSSHGITVNVTKPTSGVTITYGETSGSYTTTTNIKKTNAGTYTIYFKLTATDWDDTTGSGTITINKKDITDFDMSPTTYTYDYKEHKPTVSNVRAGTATWGKLNTNDYTVTYTNYINAGTSSTKPTVTVTVKNSCTNFKGTISKNYTINPRTLHVKALNATAIKGSTIPTLDKNYVDYEVSDLVENSYGTIQISEENRLNIFTGTMTTTATSSSAAGEYAITKGSLAFTNYGVFVATNYTMDFTGAKVYVYNNTAPYHDDVLLDTTPPVGCLNIQKPDAQGHTIAKAEALSDGELGSGIVKIIWRVRKYEGFTDVCHDLPEYNQTYYYTTSPTTASFDLGVLDRAKYDVTCLIVDAVGNLAELYDDNIYDMEVTSSGYTGVYDKKNHNITVTVQDPPASYGYTIYYYNDATNEYDLTTNVQKRNAGEHEIKFKVVADFYHDYMGSNMITITPKSINDSTIDATLSKSFVYDGSVHEPGNYETEGPRVTDSQTPLLQGGSIDVLANYTDYRLTYDADTKNVGTKTIIITGINNYKDQRSVTYTITKRPIYIRAENMQKNFSDPDPVEFIKIPSNVAGEEEPGYLNDCVRDPGEAVGTYTIRRGSLGIKDNGDFKVSNYDFGANNFTEGTFTILPKTILGLEASLDQTEYIYNGFENRPTATVINPNTGSMVDNNGKLVEGRDYEINYANNIDAGTATATITGIGNYQGTITLDYIIKQAPLTIKADDKSKNYLEENPPLTYTVTGLMPGETLKYDGEIYTDATIASLVGTYDIKLDHFIPKDDENGKFKILNYDITKVNGTLTIGALSISGATLTISPKTYVYTGLNIIPTNIDVKIVVAGIETTLQQGVDYEVECTNNINVGTATITINGIEKYSGSLSDTYQITPAEINLSVDVQGNPVVGQQVTAVYIVDPDDSNITYQWYRTESDLPENGTPIVGATSQSYTIQNGDNLYNLYCTVTAKNAPNYNDKTVAAMAPNIKETNPPTVPTIEVRYDNSTGALYDGAWTNHNIWIKLVSTDDSYVSRYEYSTTSASAGFMDVDNIENQIGTMLVDNNQDETVFYFRAIDRYGNISGVSSSGVVENVASTTLRIDKDSPVITELTLDPPSWTNGSVTAKLKATDELSSINGYYFGTSLNGTFTNIEFTNSIEESKTYTSNANSLYFVVRDRAGNIGHREFSIWNIDTVPPTITFANITNTETKAIITANVTDDLSGPKDLIVNDIMQEDFADIGGGIKQSTYEATEPGTYTFVASDNAGNIGSKVQEIYGINYNGNGVVGNMQSQVKLAGQSLTVKANEFVSTEYQFLGWNTKADGTGTSYAPGSRYTADAVITLYAQWNVQQKRLDKLILNKYEFEYTGKIITPQEKVYNNAGELLTRDLHYEVVYEDNIEVGTGIVKIHGLPNTMYAGQSLETTFKIVGTDVKEINVVLEKDIYVYDTTEHKPRAIVTYGTETLVDGKDYIMTYRDNINAGTAYAIITGIGRFYNVVEKEFSIIKADRALNIYDVGIVVGEELVLNYSYNGEEAGATIRVANSSIATLNSENVFNNVIRITGVREGRTTLEYSVGESANYNAASGFAQVAVYTDLDDSKPIYGKVLINNGDEYTCTPRTLLYISAFRADFMYIATENVKPDANANGWVDYSTRVPYVFSSDIGVKGIYVWFKDFAGNVSESASDTIILDYDYDYPAHDYIILDQTAPNSEPPEVDIEQYHNSGVDVLVTFKQQDQMINGVRAGIDESTIRYGYKKTYLNDESTPNPAEFTWQNSNRFNELIYGVSYVFVTQASDKLGNGPTISGVYEMITPVRYGLDPKLGETYAQYDGKIHEIEPVQYDIVDQHPITNEFEYTYYTDRECTRPTTIANGSKTAGGAPIKSGTYYVIARLRDDPEYHDIDSNVGKLHIGWYIQKDDLDTANTYNSETIHDYDGEIIFAYVEETATDSNQFTLTVTGHGEMLDLTNIKEKDNVEEYTYWSEYKDRITVLDIGKETRDDISNIGADVFSYLTEITEITLPDSLTEIRDNAFKGDSKVTNNIIIPSGITSIGINPFADVETQKFEVKYGNSYYETIDGVLVNIEHTDIIAYPAGNRNKEYIVPDGIENINENAFYGNDWIEHVVIPNEVETIGGRAFYACSKLEVVELHDLMENSDVTQDIISIGNEAFFGIKNNSSIFTYSKDVADMFIADITYDSNKTKVFWPPVITLHPIDTNGAAQSDVIFIVEAEAGYYTDLNYEWYVIPNGGTVDDAVLATGTTNSEGKTSRFTTTTLTESNDGEKYFCVVYNNVPNAYNTNVSYYRYMKRTRSNEGKLTILENANYRIDRESNNNHYFFTRMQEAFDFAKTDDQITVIKANVPNEPSAVLDDNKKITFSANGNTVSMDGIIEIKSGSSITFFDSGTITKNTDAYNKYMIYNNGKIVMNDDMTLSYPTGGAIDMSAGSNTTINGGTVSGKTNVIRNSDGQIVINGENAKVIATNTTTDYTRAISLFNDARIEMNSGLIQAKNETISGNEVIGLYIESTTQGRIVINGGTIKATAPNNTSGSAILNAGGTDVYIEGGAIEGSKAGIELVQTDNYGDVFLRAGTVKGNKYGILNYATNACVTLGIRDRDVKDSAPVVTGSKAAIYNAKQLDRLEYYDGTLKSDISSANIIYEMVNDNTLEVNSANSDKIFTQSGRNSITVEEGYSIFVDTEGSYNRARLRIIGAPVTSTVPDQTVDEGEKAQFDFRIVADGHPAVYEFQWEVSTDGGISWTPVITGTGMNTTSYTTPPATPQMNGYLYRCKITNGGNVSYTNSAKLKLFDDLSFQDMRPVIRITYANDTKKVLGEGEDKRVEMRIIIKSFASLQKVEFSYAGTHDLNLLGVSNSSIENSGYVIKNNGIEQYIDRGNGIFEYTQTFDLTAKENGLVSIHAVDANGRESTQTQTIDIFNDLKVTYYASTLSNTNPDLTITFIANKPVKPIDSSLNGEYYKLIPIDGKTYAYKFIYNPDIVIPAGTTFEFEDQYGNTTTCTIEESFTRVKYKEVKFNSNGAVVDIDDLTITNAYEVAENLDTNMETNADYNIQSRYGVNKLQVDMFMGRARDIGAADILNNATRTRSYDGLFARDMEATKEADDAYNYVDTARNVYMASTLDTETSISDNKNVDKISKSKIISNGLDLYKGQSLEGFVENEAEPYMYKDSSGRATNIDDNTQYDATFREVIVGN